MKWFKTRTTENGKREVFDPLRKKYVMLTPEEEVRQIILNKLIAHYDMPAGLIAVEFPIKLNGLEKRCDIVVFAPDARPLLLVECKAKHIEIGQAAFDQIQRYNSSLGATYILLTNSRTSFCGHVDSNTGQINFLKDIPFYHELNS